MDDPNFYITYNPHFNEYHAISRISHCSRFCSRDRNDVVSFILNHRKKHYVQLSLNFD